MDVVELGKVFVAGATGVVGALVIRGTKRDPVVIADEDRPGVLGLE